MPSDITKITSAQSKSLCVIFPPVSQYVPADRATYLFECLNKSVAAGLLSLLPLQIKSRCFFTRLFYHFGA